MRVQRWLNVCKSWLSSFCNQTTVVNDCSSSNFNEDYKSLCHDKEQIIQKLKKRLESCISTEELNTILDSKENSCRENTNNESCFSSSDNINCNKNTLVPTEEVCMSLPNDKDKVIQRLTSRLKDFVTCNEINKLLILNLIPCDSNEAVHPCENPPSNTKISNIYKTMKNIVLYITFNLFKFIDASELSNVEDRIDISDGDSCESSYSQSACEKYICEENDRLKNLVNLKEKELEKRENFLHQLKIDLLKLNGTIIKDPCF